MTSPPQLAEALAAAARGWRVFPAAEPRGDTGACSCKRGTACADPGKHPRVKGWQDEATADEQKIRRWWARWPSANPAIATGAASGLVVLDVDPKHGGDESLHDLESIHGALPPTALSLTGGGGRHYLFAHPGGEIPNMVGDKDGKGGVAPGLDIRGDGGLIIAPGSRHVRGRQYAWEWSAHPDNVPLAPLTPWLLEMILGADRKGTAADVPERIPEGERNATLTSLAGTMRRRGMSKDAILAALGVENERCDPEPLGEDELEQIAESVSRYKPADVREHLEAIVAASTNGSTPSRNAPALSLEFPKAAWHGIFEDYREAMGTTEAPDAHHFGTAVTVFGWLLGRRVYTHYDRRTYPNQNTVLVGATGVTRKTGSMRRGTDLAIAAEPDAPYITAIGSAEGLMETLATAGMSPEERQQYGNHVNRVRVDENGEPHKKGEIPDLPLAPPEGRRLLLAPEEWATMLAKGRQEGAGNLTPIITYAYDCPERFNPPTRNNQIVAHKPTLSILTASAPIWVEKFLTISELISGFANRFGYWLGESKDPVPWPEPPRQEPLNRVVKALYDTLSYWEGREHEFALSAEARRSWEGYYSTHRSRLAAYSETHAAVVQRAPTFAVKLALIFAAFGSDSAIIDTEDLERATMIADYLEAGAGELLGSLGESPDTELERKILKRLADGTHIKRRALQQAVGGRYTAEKFNRTVEAMTKTGILPCDKDGAYFDPVAQPQEAQHP